MHTLMEITQYTDFLNFVIQERGVYRLYIEDIASDGSAIVETPCYSSDKDFSEKLNKVVSDFLSSIDPDRRYNIDFYVEYNDDIDALLLKYNEHGSNLALFVNDCGIPYQIKHIIKTLIKHRDSVVYFLFAKEKDFPLMDSKFMVHRMLRKGKCCGNLGVNLEIIDAHHSEAFLNELCGKELARHANLQKEHHPDVQGYLSSSLYFIPFQDTGQYRLVLRRVGKKLFDISISKYVNELLEKGEITKEDLK